MTRILKCTAIILAVAALGACGEKSPEDRLRESIEQQIGANAENGLRESFAQQLGANKFIKDFQKNGDELTFTGPGADGGEAKWRVHIDSTAIEPTEKDKEAPSFDVAAMPFKGHVKSSWFSNDRPVIPRNSRESNLPIELMDNGLAQECWAYWDNAGKKWSWE